MRGASWFVAARTRNVRFALLHQLAAEGLGNDSTLVEVGHELPRDLHLPQALYTLCSMQPCPDCNIIPPTYICMHAKTIHCCNKMQGAACRTSQLPKGIHHRAE